MPEGCCQKIHQKIHIDSLIDSMANNCPRIERLEIRWDPQTLRFSDRSNKAIGMFVFCSYNCKNDLLWLIYFPDAARLKCLRLRCLCLSDGKYFEMVYSLNFKIQLQSNLFDFVGEKQLRTCRSRHSCTLNDQLSR